MLDRKQAPPFKLSPDFEFLQAQSRPLSESINAFFISSKNQELLKIDFVFSAGIKYSPKPGLAKAVSDLIVEGTHQKSSLEISESIEGQGAFIQTSCSLDNASITLYVLQSKVKPVLEEVLELFENASFPEHEIENYKSRQIQKLKVNQEKVAFLAKQAFKNQLFPQGHPYHNKLELSVYESLHRDDLLDFYEKQYKNKLPRIYLSGNLNNRVWKDMEQAFEKYSFQAIEEVDFKDQLIQPLSNASLNIQKSDALQCALSIGKPCINRHDLDYQKLMIVNTLLGGYFGSRLMSNIREDKGYTYGIGSGVFSFQHAAYFYIHTEVGQAVSQQTVQEVQNEMNRLQKEEVGKQELQLVKNYLIGSLMRNFDGAYEAMDRFKGLNEFGMGYEFYKNLFLTIQEISPEEILEIANKHLHFNDMMVVSAGNFKIEATI